MHLNGVGTVRDCDIAVNLLKKVCERGEWVSSKLVEAYDGSEGLSELTAFLFLKLAEAGHEVAQMNVAHLLDSGQAWLLQPGTVEEDPSEEQRLGNKVSAQRFYEMSAEQGSASSELRLGDYAFYGWGLAADVDDGDTETPENEIDKVDTPDSLSSLDDELSAGELEIKFVRQPIDYTASLAHYRKTSEMQITGEWMQTFVARASFNLGFMHQFGFGVSQDLHLARRHYQRCLEIDPSGVHTPITTMLILLTVHSWMLDLPPTEKLQAAFMNDQRSHFLVVQLIMIIVLIFMRRHFTAVPARRRASQVPRIPSRPSGLGQQEAQ
jgi:TPR repeat protein